jgi:hypothetical protein
MSINKMSFDEALQNAIKMICKFYKNDLSSPSIVLSYLPDMTYYVSIVRYTERLGQGKQVIAKARNVDMYAALESALLEWIAVRDNKF